MTFPSESFLAENVERIRAANPDSRELVDAILALVDTKWFEPDVSEPLIAEASALADRLDYRLGWARAQTFKAEATYIRTRYEEALPIIAGVIPILIQEGAQTEYAWCLLLLSAVSQATGAYDSALQHGFKALQISTEAGAEEATAWNHYRIADVYRELGDREQMLEYAQGCYDLFEDLYARSGWKQHLIGTGRARTQLAMAFELNDHLDKSLEFNEAALERYRESGDPLGATRAITDLGRVWGKKGDHAKAEEYLTDALNQRRRLGHRASQTSNLLALGRLALERGEVEKAVDAFEEMLSLATEANIKMRAYEAHHGLSDVYAMIGDTEKALAHFRQFHQLKEDLAGEAIRLRIYNARMLADVERAERQAEQERSRSEELDAKNRELADLLDELSATQDRLIHAEKMASLGQLTAGIAHEIRNPLNFVNNFSELSEEIVSEMTEVLNRCSARLPEAQQEEMVESLDTLKFNTSKIREHGARADSIVKSMLQHSRTGKGKVSSVDINSMVEEYLNLAYHGMRARNPDFNASLELEFDPDVGHVECVAQDIGRVLLNLFGNAFDALMESGVGGQTSGVGPTVSVATSKSNGRVEIRVSDNGPGIPDDVKSRIFEPFFTTKPTGSGTGLGLSMSYDIITKGHGGELGVESEVGKGATFTVRLPA